MIRYISGLFGRKQGQDDPEWLGDDMAPAPQALAGLAAKRDNGRVPARRARGPFTTRPDAPIRATDA